MKKTDLNLFKKLSLIIAAIFMVSAVWAQQSITGTVTDNGGESLPGVAVVIQGSYTGTVTSVDGVYSLDAPPDATLLFSFVGMKSVAEPVNGRTTIDITMLVDAIGLEEVVAIGYGTQKKKSLTGAISTIDDAEIQTTTSTSLAQKLQGKVAGLNIRQNNAEPGKYDNSINIRGFGTPLYVIDGIVRGDSKDFQRLRSEDIESISVLKDASAAIYGMNAANGVIIVTTKKGGEGKTRFSFSATTGFSSPTDIPDMANAAQYVEMRIDAYDKNPNVGLIMRTISTGKNVNKVVDPTTVFTLKLRIKKLEKGEQYFFRMGALIDVPEAKYNWSDAVRLGV